MAVGAVVVMQKVTQVGDLHMDVFVKDEWMKDNRHSTVEVLMLLQSC